jgi:hypothetical protein
MGRDGTRRPAQIKQTLQHRPAFPYLYASATAFTATLLIFPAPFTQRNSWFAPTAQCSALPGQPVHPCGSAVRCGQQGVGFSIVVILHCP